MSVSAPLVTVVPPDLANAPAWLAVHEITAGGRFVVQDIYSAAGNWLERRPHDDADLGSIWSGSVVYKAMADGRLLVSNTGLDLASPIANPGGVWLLDVSGVSPVLDSHAYVFPVDMEDTWEVEDVGIITPAVTDGSFIWWAEIATTSVPTGVPLDGGTGLPLFNPLLRIDVYRVALDSDLTSLTPWASEDIDVVSITGDPFAFNDSAQVLVFADNEFMSDPGIGLAVSESRVSVLIACEYQHGGTTVANIAHVFGFNKNTGALLATTARDVGAGGLYPAETSTSCVGLLSDQVLTAYPTIEVSQNPQQAEAIDWDPSNAATPTWATEDVPHYADAKLDGTEMVFGDAWNDGGTWRMRLQHFSSVGALVTAPPIDLPPPDDNADLWSSGGDNARVLFWEPE